MSVAKMGNSSSRNCEYSEKQTTHLLPKTVEELINSANQDTNAQHELSKLHLRADTQITKLMWKSIKKNRKDQVESILKSGFDVNTTIRVCEVVSGDWEFSDPEFKFDSLFLALLLRNDDISRLLISYGANADRVRNEAIRMHYPMIMERLTIISL
jgi:hypothetical protein